MSKKAGLNSLHAPDPSVAKLIDRFPNMFNSHTKQTYEKIGEFNYAKTPSENLSKYPELGPF